MNSALRGELEELRSVKLSAGQQMEKVSSEFANWRTEHESKIQNKDL
jgi:hypothetical protein